jgi:outer membrane lipoprotein SlyB
MITFGTKRRNIVMGSAGFGGAILGKALGKAIGKEIGAAVAPSIGRAILGGGLVGAAVDANSRPYAARRRGAVELDDTEE